METLSPEEKIEYFENALPSRWVNTSKERFNGNPIKDIDNFEDFLFGRCKSILVRTRLNKKNKPNYIETICDEEEISREVLKDELNLKKFLYYKTHFFNNRKASNLVNLDTENLVEKLSEKYDSGEEDVEELVEEAISNSDEFNKANSNVGANIWSIIERNPKANFVHLEWPILIAEFYSEGNTRSYYIEKKGEYVEVPSLQKVVVRIDFRNKVAEIQSSNSKESTVEKVKEKIEMLLAGAISLDEEIEITDEFIKFMEDEDEVSEYVRTRHANHEGEAKSSWSGPDIHEDPEYNEVQNRPHIDKNIEYSVNGLGNLTIGYSKNSNAIQIFKQKMKTHERKQVIKFLLGYYNDFN